MVSGACTALLGKEGAMACTVAVEESISEHYNSQIRTLMEADPERYTELLQVMCVFIPVLSMHTYHYFIHTIFLAKWKKVYI